ncbi:MAG TPA: 3'-5' exonuclease, partial [Burkholderiaceae bacterium]|nr:3'-5' exonuclease [Burkholderiaceae bacterium]
SIDALLRWLSASRQTPSGDEETQTRLESDRKLVQIVTIHRAKGLEYGVVFCPFLWDGALRPPAGGDAIDYHDDDGRLCVDFRPGVGDDRALKDLRRFERHAEHLRLIYVALTRAVYRCYLVAGLYRTGGGATRAERSLLNWLVAGDGMGLDAWPNNKLDGDAIMAARRSSGRRSAPARGRTGAASPDSAGRAGGVADRQLQQPALGERRNAGCRCRCGGPRRDRGVRGRRGGRPPFGVR